MKIKCSKIFFAFFMAIFSLFGSCSFISDNDSSNANPLNLNKARLFVSVNNNLARTILPDTLTEDDIISVNLRVTNTLTSENLIRSWNNDSETGKTALAQMKADTQIFINPGTYDFKLELSTSKGLCQTGSLLNKAVEAGDNALSFTTKYVTDSTGLGEFYIILSWASSDRIGRIDAGLFTEESNGETAFYDMSPLTISSTSAVYDKNSVPVGTYFIRFDIYDTSLEKLNTIEDVIRIVSGRRTSSTISLTDLNSVYTINYNLNAGEWESPSYTPVTKRNARKIVTLPTAADVKRTGFVFDGWFESDDGGTTLKGEALTSIGAGTARDLDLYAKWTRLNEFFVSSTGNDSTGIGTEERPFASVQKAVSIIKDNNDSTTDYKIWIDGTVRENVLLTDIVGSSLTISGATGASSDTLNGDTDGDGTGDGSVITVQTAVPVTINNLKITGGQANGGGGIFVGIGANVMLSSGTVISGNKSTSNGGGVYVSGGTLLVNDDSVIGSKGSASAANNSNYSNYASNYGGGIYNKGGKIYLGYKIASDGTLTQDTGFTGGIYYNYADYMGGGIYDDTGSGAEVKMSGGEIAFNAAKDDGGAVRLANSDVFTVSGGKIHNNVANLALYTNGGGAFYVGSGSTLLLTGGELSSNVAHRGRAIYTNTGAIIKMSGSASIPAGSTASHDVFLADGVTIEVESPFDSGLSLPVATITPSNYAHGTTAVLCGTSMGTEYTKFAVTPRGTEHWSVSSTGTIIQNIDACITITVSTYTNDDLELTATESGSNYVFTAKAGYSSYLWTVAGQIAPSTTNSVTIPKSGLPRMNVLMVVAVDSSGNAHEAKCTFTVTD